MASNPSFSERTAMILGPDRVADLAKRRVCVFGLGGVGAACAVDLVRSGVGTIVACDFDEVSETNLNRLAFGLRSYLGLPKARAFGLFARDINPQVIVEERELFISGENASASVPPDCDFYVDCIDSLNPKVRLLAHLVSAGLPFISSMGMGGRLDPSRVKLGNLWQTHHCSLARSVRGRLRKAGVPLDAPIPCVWSDEESLPPGDFDPPREGLGGRPRRRIASAPFVPQTAGHFLAYYVVASLIKALPGRPGVSAPTGAVLKDTFPKSPVPPGERSRSAEK